MQLRATTRPMLFGCWLLATGWLLLCATAQEPAESPARRTAPQAAASLPAPDFELPTPDGRIIRLSDQRNKVVVLEFLQTGCPLCQEAGDTLQRLYDSNGRDLQVIGISHDRAGMDAIREYQFQHRLTYPVVLGDLEVAVRYMGITRQKPSFQVPAFIFIDREGRVVRSRWRENANDLEWFQKLPESLEQSVQGLLGPPEKKEERQKKEKKEDPPEKAKRKTQKHDRGRL